jgi:HSP20 family protein
MQERKNHMTVTASWELFEDVRAAQEELLRLSRGRDRRFGEQSGLQYRQQYDGGAGTTAWAPPVDISEREDAYLVTVEIPGVPAGDLDISLADGVLTVAGERPLTGDRSGETVHRAERYFGNFRRSITLPSHVTADDIDASIQEGVLQILVPKAPEVQAKHIPVRAGERQGALTPVSSETSDS